MHSLHHGMLIHAFSAQQEQLFVNGLRYLQRMVVYHVNVEAPYSLAQPHTEIHSITGWTPPQKEFSFSKPLVFCEAPNALKTVTFATNSPQAKPTFSHFCGKRRKYLTPPQNGWIFGAWSAWGLTPPYLLCAPRFPASPGVGVNATGHPPPKCKFYISGAFPGP